MKEHAKKALKHDTKVLGKTVPTMLIIGLFLVGGGSAALLSSFGSVSGNADVSQAVYFDSGEGVNTELDASYNGAAVAGTTTTTEFTLKNNASVPATVRLVSDAEGITGISQIVTEGAYEEQTYDIGQYWPASGDGVLDSVETTDQDVTVNPSINEVSYTVERKEGTLDGEEKRDMTDNGGGTQLLFSSQSYQNTPHIRFEYGTDENHDWVFKYNDGSSWQEVSYSSASELVDAKRVVESANYDSENNEVEVTLRKEPGVHQSFAVVDTYGGDKDSATMTWAEAKVSGGEKSYKTDVAHELVSYPEVVSDSQGSVTDVVLEPGTQEFNLATEFDVALDPTPVVGNAETGELDPAYADEETGSEADGYNVDLTVDTVTQ